MYSSYSGQTSSFNNVYYRPNIMCRRLWPPEAVCFAHSPITVDCCLRAHELRGLLFIPSQYLLFTPVRPLNSSRHFIERQALIFLSFTGGSPLRGRVLPSTKLRGSPDINASRSYQFLSNSRFAQHPELSYRRKSRLLGADSPSPHHLVHNDIK
ncbi:hypothetical protein AVEN_244353-1 [Araneus ventricosus]|uniref:Uncharacterized protein n=1 Tax=Araneus ventricosus TaxID=182803 RepID=A0A4Y2TDT6_ARAVE|nr:hypothetical protein AVEN_244353-1 [Araneus ventricosus]